MARSWRWASTRKGQSAASVGALVMHSVANVDPDEPVAVALGDTPPALGDSEALATPDRVDLAAPAGVIFVEYFARARVVGNGLGNVGIWPDLRIDGDRAKLLDSMQFVDPYSTGANPLSVSAGVNTLLIQTTSDMPGFIGGNSLLEPPALPAGAWAHSGIGGSPLVAFEVGPGDHTVEVLWARDSDVADAADIRNRRLTVLG